MALFYSMVQRKILGGEMKGSKLWFGQLKTSGVISFEDLCEEATNHSMVTMGDVSGVMKGVLKRVVVELADGNIVGLGRLGKFRLTVGSRGVENPEEFTTHHMKRPKVTLAPGGIIRDLIQNIGFRREPIKEVIIPYEPCPEHG